MEAVTSDNTYKAHLLHLILTDNTSNGLLDYGITTWNKYEQAWPTYCATAQKSSVHRP